MKFIPNLEWIETTLDGEETASYLDFTGIIYEEIDGTYTVTILDNDRQKLLYLEDLNSSYIAKLFAEMAICICNCHFERM